MALDAAVQAWLIAQLGTETDTADLQLRYLRLGTARAVALEVVSQRLADLRAQAATINLSSVVAVSYTENIRAYERQLAALTNGDSPAPDDPPTSTDTTPELGVFFLRERPRR